MITRKIKGIIGLKKAVDFFSYIGDNNIMVNQRDIRVGDLLTLRGVTGHGKNRIRQHGKTWRVTNTQNDTSFGHLGLESLEETFGGFLPPNKGLKVKDSRWITSHGDKNFDIIAHIRGDDTLWEE